MSDELRRSPIDRFLIAGESPAIEVSTTGGQIVITVCLPGVKTEDIRLEFTDHALAIQCEGFPERAISSRGFVAAARRRPPGQSQFKC